MHVPDGNRDVAPQPGKGGRSETRLRMFAVPSARKPRLGCAKLTRDGIPGAKVVRGIRHEGDAAAVERCYNGSVFAASPFPAAAFTQGERHQEERLPGPV